MKQEEETENLVFLFSISVTRVTPDLYVNMTKEPLSKLFPCSRQASPPSDPDTLGKPVRGKLTDPAQRLAGPPRRHPSLPPAVLALPHIYLPAFFLT